MAKKKIVDKIIAQTTVEKSNNVLPYIFILLIVVSLFLFYTAYDKTSKSLVFETLVKVLSFEDFNKSLREINKVFALAAIGLIAISFILGPLSRFWPNLFAKYLYFRKPVGLAGFVLGIVHGAYSAMAFYNLDVSILLLQNEKSLALIFGVLGTIVFIVMSATSNKTMMEKLGYKTWKAIQTFGYFGLLFIILHFLLIETKPDKGFDVRPYGLVFFYLAIAALILRIIVIFVSNEPRKVYEHHFGEK
ncbi:MAG: ferric reductase-like transmembrane domain-containing protein [Candidatus Micrarchaeota archaeon]|nr:ferric reductase-like transmembrane domain-containing protein [Candidatus Micrarchaeota archaeon]